MAAITASQTVVNYSVDVLDVDAWEISTKLFPATSQGSADAYAYMRKMELAGSPSTFPKAVLG